MRAIGLLLKKFGLVVVVVVWLFPRKSLERKGDWKKVAAL
jgi:hypothetical protein